MESSNSGAPPAGSHRVEQDAKVSAASAPMQPAIPPVDSLGLGMLIRKRTPTVYRRIAAALGAVGLGVVVLFYRLGPGGIELITEASPLDALIEWLKQNPQAEANELFFRALMSKLAMAQEQKTRDVDYAVWWEGQIWKLKDLAEQIPTSFSNAFAAAASMQNRSRRESLLADWNHLREDAVAMAIGPVAYVAQAESMRGQIALHEFTTVIDAVRHRLPERIAHPANLANAEAVAEAFDAYRRRPWQGVPDEEKDKAFGEIETQLSDAMREYVSIRRNTLLADYRNHEDPGSAASDFFSLGEAAPVLASLVQDDLTGAYHAVQEARSRFNQMNKLTISIQRLRQAVPERCWYQDDNRRIRCSA